MGGGDEAAEVGVSGGRFSEEGEVGPRIERDFRAGDGLDAKAFGGLGERHGSVETMVVGKGHGRIAQVRRLEHQLFGRRRPIQE